MSVDRRFIGMVSEPRRIEIEKGQLCFFAKATGATDPVYFDEAAAQAAGHPTLPVPPTFLFSLQLGAPAERGSIFGDMGIDLRSVLHGEQSFTHHRHLYAGDTATLVTETVDIYEKKGGALEFVVQDTRAVNQHGELCVEMRSITVVRRMEDAA